MDLDFSVSYTSDIDTVKSVMLSVAKAHPSVKQEPAPFARLVRQEDSALVFQLRVWCDTQQYWTVHHDMNEQMKNEFDRQGISIPYPQMDVHIQS